MHDMKNIKPSCKKSFGLLLLSMLLGISPIVGKNRYREYPDLAYYSYNFEISLYCDEGVVVMKSYSDGLLKIPVSEVKKIGLASQRVARLFFVSLPIFITALFAYSERHLGLISLGLAISIILAVVIPPGRRLLFYMKDGLIIDGGVFYADLEGYNFINELSVYIALANHKKEAGV